MTHHLTSNKQKEAESKRKPPSEPICCTTTGRSAANSLAQTIGAASLSTREAQVKSTASPPHLRERRSQPRSAAGEPTPLKRAAGWNLTVRPTSDAIWCSCLDLLARMSLMLLSTAQQLKRLSLTSLCLLFTSCLLQIFCLLFFFRRGGDGVGGRTKGGNAAGAGQRQGTGVAPQLLPQQRPERGERSDTRRNTLSSSG